MASNTDRPSSRNHSQVSRGAIADTRQLSPQSIAELNQRLSLSQDAHGEEVLVSSPLLLPAMETAMTPEDSRRRLRLGAEGTYLNDLLSSRDSALTRWPERTTRPLRVFIREAESVEGWNHDFLTVTRDAFDTWVQTGIPLRFTFVVDSATADVQVHFVDTFSSGISGRTVWSRDPNYWLVSGDIQLALSHPGGGVLTPPQMRAIALHEVGHLIGLDHATDPDRIMSARVRVRELSEEDRSTARLIYAVPAGSIK